MRTFDDLNRPYLLKKKQIESFKQKGFIKLKNVLSEETVVFYKDLISAIVLGQNTQTKPLEERDLYHQAFLQVSNLWTKSGQVKAFVFSKRLAKIASALLKVSGVRMYHDQALYKEPGGGITPWHADQQYWPLATDKCVTAWLPLQKTPIEMGALAFAEGSHKLMFGRDIAISAKSEKEIEAKVTQNDIPHHVSAFDLGEVSFHYGWTWHRAGANKSNKARAVMTIIYMDENMKLQEPSNENQKVDRDVFCAGVQVGEIINSELNPVLFSSGVQ